MANKLNTLNELQIATNNEIRVPATLDPEVIQLLVERIKDEYTAHYFYRNAANWCEDKGYLKAAAYFTEEASTELTHAEKAQKYLVDWNAMPIIAPIKMFPAYTSLIDVVNKAYDMEFNLLLAYNSTSQQVFPSCLSTFDFLQELRQIQVTSVAEYATLLNGAALVNVSNNFEVLYFEQTYF